MSSGRKHTVACHKIPSKRLLVIFYFLFFYQCGMRVKNTHRFYHCVFSRQESTSGVTGNDQCSGVITISWSCQNVYYMFGIYVHDTAGEVFPMTQEPIPV